MSDLMPSPAAQQAVLALDMVEDVLLEVKGLPGRVDRRAIVSSLEATIAALHQVVRSKLSAPDHFERIDAARACTEQAAEAVYARDPGSVGSGLKSRLDAVDRALEHAREAAIDAVVLEDRGAMAAELRARAEERLPAARPFRVSAGVPELHTLEREVIRARVDTAAPIDFVFREESPNAPASPDGDELEDDAEPATAEEWLAEEPEPALPPDDAVKRLTVLGDRRVERCLDPLALSGFDGEIAQLRRVARDCIEEIGAVSNLRRLRDGERYRRSAMARFEQRMLDALDALVSLGEPFVVGASDGRAWERFDVVDTIVTYGRDALTAEPGRAFARTFALGCIAGDDAVRASVLALKQSHPYTHEAQRHALSLASSPAIVPAMARLCGDRDPALVVLALDVLELRARIGSAEIDLGTLAPLLEHPRVAVRQSAVGALAACHRASAVPHLLDLCEREVEDDVLIAAYRALAWLGHAQGANGPRERLREERDEAGQLTPPTRTALMQLLAVSGNAHDHVLLGELYGANRVGGSPAEAAALGFHGHVAHVEPLLASLAADKTTTRQRRAAARALWRITGAPRQRPKVRSQHDIYDLQDDRAGWADWWDREGERFDPTLRYRFGQLHHPRLVREELLGENVPSELRRICADELAILLHSPPIPTSGFVAQQARLLEAHEPAIAAVTTGGGWPKVVPSNGV